MLNEDVQIQMEEVQVVDQAEEVEVKVHQGDVVEVHIGLEVPLVLEVHMVMSAVLKLDMHHRKKIMIIFITLPFLIQDTGAEVSAEV